MACYDQIESLTGKPSANSKSWDVRRWPFMHAVAGAPLNAISSVEQLSALLQELDIAIEDVEHPDISLTRETEWCLSAFPSGLLVWENLEAEEANPKHVNGVPREEVLALWLKLAQGDIEAVQAESWLQGNYSAPSSG